MRYVTLIAVLALLGTNGSAIGQERHGTATRAGASHRTAEHTVAAPRESLDESVTRLAMRGTTPTKTALARKDLLGLYLLLASAPSPNHTSH